MKNLNEEHKNSNSNIVKSKNDSYAEIYKNKLKNESNIKENNFSQSLQNSKFNVNINEENNKIHNSKITQNNMNDKKEINNKNILKYIKENTSCFSYMKEEQKTNNDIDKKDNMINNKINLEKNLKQFINKLQDNKNCEESDNFKNVKEEEKKNCYISNLSSIENDKNNTNKNNSINKLNLIKNENSSFDKENIDINIINSLKEEKEIYNIYSPVISDIKIKNEIESEKPKIYDVNYIKLNKTPNIEQLIKFNETENNTNNKENKDNKDNKNNDENKKYTNIINYKKNANYVNDNEKDFKNSKLNQFLKKFDIDRKIKTKNDNLRLKFLTQKINNKKYIDKNANDENVKELTYTGLKRYRHSSTPSLRQFHVKINNFKSNPTNERRQNKINLIKNEIAHIYNLTNITYNKKDNLNLLKKFNKKAKNILTMDHIYRSISKPNINNSVQEKTLNNILYGLNKTIKKLPKKETNNINVEENKTSRTFPINYFEFNGINNFIKSNKNNNAKNIYYNYYKNEYKRKYNNFNEKNEKLIFETKVNNMNNTISKLLHKNPDSYIKNNSTHPANIFRKNKSITNICFDTKCKSFW